MSNKISSFFFSLYMRELILERQGYKVPSTKRKNLKRSKDIDGIWGRTGINIYARVYVPFNQGPN